MVNKNVGKYNRLSILFCSFLFVSSLFGFSVPFFLFSCELLENFLEFHFYSSLVFLNVSLCVYFLVVVLGITLYIHNLSQSVSVIIFQSEI